MTGADEREATLVGLALLIGIGAVFSAFLALAVFLFVRLARLSRGWSTARAMTAASEPRSAGSRQSLEALERADPGFSVVSFEDFVYSLYTELEVARGRGQLARFSPWLGPSALQALEATGMVPVSDVVVGALGYTAVSLTDGTVRVVLSIEANYTEAPPGGRPRSYWSRELWELTRAVSARSRPPERVRAFDCPNCGAPADQLVGATCRYCQQTVNTGAFDWVVTSIGLVAREERPPSLTGTAEETGTALPTLLDPRLGAMSAALRERDPSFDDRAFLARVELVFRTMQVAWSSLDWPLVRPFLSDNLWRAQTYWIEAYRRSGLRNITENATISRIELVRVTSDHFYDAITVRIYASSLDYTVRDADRAIVGGSRSAPRAYTEYWTFIRGTGAKGPARTEPVCPSCGAALALDAAGECGYCRATLTRGEFDWVLSRIEQDEVYQG
ncbi:MAG: TIM44-like domain-containing protein [Sorangiineae bacterium]|nr:TIM44-like domain-containing protein [Polyangiaceae bacterium]MEB2324410.1 TIM44-like domain-containing protein [Sorangiineae bacterium]